MPQVISIFGYQADGYMVHAVMFGCAFVGVVVTVLAVGVLDLVREEFRNGSSNGPSDLRRLRSDDERFNDTSKSGDDWGQ